MRLKLSNGYPEYHVEFPDEPWTNCAHETIEDWESSSYGVTAGFFPGGAEVELLEQHEHQFTSEGGMHGQTLFMYKVRGLSIENETIEGWVTPFIVESTDV